MRVLLNAFMRTLARSRRGNAAAACITMTVMLVTTARAVSSFVAMDLGAIGGTSSYAYAANAGVVAGYGYVAGNADYHAFAWTPSNGMLDLGTLGGNNSYAAAVSDQGVVYGVSEVAGGLPPHIFAWSASTGVIDLGSLAPNSYVTAMNNNGTAIGYRFTDDQYYYRAFVWSRDTGQVDLGTLGNVAFGYSDALAVNNRGVVVGWSSTPSGASHAFLWSRARGMVDLGVLTAFDSNSYAAAISDTGIVAGVSNVGPSITELRNHAFVWTRTDGMRDLRTLGGSSSWARAVNSTGVVAGISYTRAGDTQAFASDANGMVAINPFGGGGSDVTTINDKGVVVGGGWTPSYVWHAFVWTRRDGPTELTPAAGFIGNSYVAALTTDGLMAGSSCSPDPSGPEHCHATIWKSRSKR